MKLPPHESRETSYSASDRERVGPPAFISFIGLIAPGSPCRATRAYGEVRTMSVERNRSAHSGAR